ncbi:MAG TPA: DNA mismatch repair protein MutS [Candidatus Kapabacteria bacterium]|nr:DNA mismatch repair protein MutS [Candidatus Kapabacteria bacterium]
MPKTKPAEEKQTPLMKQYSAVKARYPDTVLFFRMGDFFETFGEDAITLAKVTGIALTKRNNGSAGDTELAGFPHHQLDNYLPKMIRAGFRVAVCEQLEDPKLAKGIVKRDVVEVVTPGVQLSEKILETGRNTYVGAIVHVADRVGIAFADVSTGEFSAGELRATDLGEELVSLGLRELLTSRRDKPDIEQSPYFLVLEQKPVLTIREEWAFQYDTARKLLLDHFSTTSLKGFGLEELHLATTAAGVVLDYLRETRTAGALKHITKLTLHNTSNALVLDQSTRRNLEIFFSFSGDEKNGSLLGVLHETKTAMGERLLRRWLSSPLRDKQELLRRQDAISLASGAHSDREDLRRLLAELGDLERLIGRFAGARLLSQRDFITLKHTLWRIPDITQAISRIAQFAAADESGSNTSELLERLASELNELTELSEQIDRTVDPEAPAGSGSLGVIRDGANAELDELRSLTKTSRTKLLEIQARERERTSIPSLKVDFNGVFGYYIEVSHVHRSKIPDDYERKQTLTNSERYVTPELKEYEQKILGAEEKMFSLEAELIARLRAAVISHTGELQQNATLLAIADVIQSLATVASRGSWVRPEFTNGDEFIIDQGRHPVVERSLPIGERFTPNSVKFKTGAKEFYVITGPNMSGKSVYLRQTGIIALLAHIGSFVPAVLCKMPLLDRIFTRVGAGDNLSRGESTFLVEMNETANILNNATKDSLLLFDELGRGTSTFDGLSIAWAISEHVHDSIPGARTLFATHYHELNALADRFEHIGNLKVEVREADGKVHFLHKITNGSADHSYGIEVAAMAGIAPEVIDRAREILHELEETELKIAESNIQRSIPFPPAKHHEPEETREIQNKYLDAVIVDELKTIDVNAMTPLDALAKVAEWKQRIEQ